MANKNSILDVVDILNDYSEEIKEEMTSKTQIKAKEGANTLKARSPKRTGKYAKDWSVKTTKGRDSIECVIHNTKHYQLTHLLEKPHLKRNGELTTPESAGHIKEVEVSLIKDYESAVDSIIRRG